MHGDLAAGQWSHAGRRGTAWHGRTNSVDVVRRVATATARRVPAAAFSRAWS
jgi:hypothetical protein